ncbi:MAG: histidine kinase [Roseivirga sp.]|nr:histidine kinase [Roseivirga sp.]
MSKLSINRPTRHIIFWVLLYGLNLLFWGSSLEYLAFALAVNLFFLAFRIPFAYFNIYYLIPKFLKQGKLFTYTLIVLLSLVVLSIFYRFVVGNFWMEVLYAGPDQTYELNTSFFSHLKQFMIEVYVQGIVLSVKLGQDWLNASKKASELESKQIETELNMLKNQIQPHFFFNTLNSLYALCMDEPKKAGQSILGLSDVMDYILYRSSRALISLEEEMTIVKKYIALESLRFDDRIEVNIHMDDEAVKAVIPPVVILSLVENSFKHGLHEVNSTASLQITIKLTDHDWLEVEVTNTAPDRLEETGDSTGIGLKNIERRLELIFDHYVFETSHENSLFKVHLKIPVNAN